MPNVNEKIETILSENKTVLFMKGDPAMPLCGFSAKVAAILNEVGVKYHSLNVLEDQELREGIKVYGNWPTIPQLYINKKLIGGSDIIMEMFETGELQQALDA